MNVNNLTGSLIDIDENKLTLIRKNTIGMSNLVIYFYDKNNKKQNIITYLKNKAVNTKGTIFVMLVNKDSVCSRIEKYNKNGTKISDICVKELDLENFDKVIDSKKYNINYTFVATGLAVATAAAAAAAPLARKTKAFLRTRAFDRAQRVAAATYAAAHSSSNIPRNGTLTDELAYTLIDEEGHADIPPEYTTIGVSAFEHVYSLESVKLLDSVKTIDNSAFSNCYKLTSVTIPDSVTTIGEYAFSSCTRLSSATIGNSVKTIGEYAFYDCTSLKSINIPDSVTTIGSNVFFWCSNLTSVTIGNRVTTIGDYAFKGCTRLTSVTIPDSVVNIGKRAFANTNLNKVIYKKKIYKYLDTSFSNFRDEFQGTIANNAFDNIH